jgi:hypothetical protein
MEEYKYFCEKCNYGTNIKNSYNKHKESNLHIEGIRKSKEKKEQVIYKCDLCDYKSNIKYKFYFNENKIYIANFRNLRRK